MRSVGKIGEAVVIADPMSITTEESVGSLNEESVVFVLGVPAHNRSRRSGADRLRRVPAGPPHVAVVRSIVAQPSSQLDPQQPGPGHMAAQAGAFRMALGIATYGPLLCRPRLLIDFAP